jgi:hypothetical protein
LGLSSSYLIVPPGLVVGAAPVAVLGVAVAEGVVAAWALRAAGIEAAATEANAKVTIVLF